MSSHFLFRCSDDPKITGVRGDYAPTWLIRADGPRGQEFQSLAKDILEATWRQEPIFPLQDEFPRFSFELKKSAKPISFLKFGPYFPATEFLIDSNAKAVFDRLNLQNHRTYPAELYVGERWVDYWMFFIHPLPYEAINFSQSVFYMGLPFAENEIRFECLDDFKSSEIYKGEDLWRLRIDTLALNSSVDQTFNLFCLPFDRRLVVSEFLVKELKQSGCVGQDFVPIESQTIGNSLLFSFPKA